MHRKRPAFHPDGNNGGDPPSFRCSCPDSIFQSCPHPHCTTARDAHSLLGEVWHEPGMVPKASVLFVNVVLAIYIYIYIYICMYVRHLIWNIWTISHRCLQDNEWDFNRAAQVFTQLKVACLFSLLQLKKCLIISYQDTKMPSHFFFPDGRQDPGRCIHKMKSWFILLWNKICSNFIYGFLFYLLLFDCSFIKNWDKVYLSKDVFVLFCFNSQMWTVWP